MKQFQHPKGPVTNMVNDDGSSQGDFLYTVKGYKMVLAHNHWASDKAPAACSV